MDKTGRLHLIKEIHRYTWNFDTNKPCFMIPYINKTGVASVKGTLVMFDTANDYSFVLNTAGATGDEPIGVVYENGIDDGNYCRVIVAGSALVLLQDTTASTRGNWMKNSDTVAGRVDATNASPIPAQHWREIGHCCESQSAGTDVLAEGMLHFN